MKRQRKDLVFTRHGRKCAHRHMHFCQKWNTCLFLLRIKVPIGRHVLLCVLLAQSVNQLDCVFTNMASQELEIPFCCLQCYCHYYYCHLSVCSNSSTLCAWQVGRLVLGCVWQVYWVCLTHMCWVCLTCAGLCLTSVLGMSDLCWVLSDKCAGYVWLVLGCVWQVC